ncbi:ABC transporter permease [Paenibacillus sediminis]|uniref:Peptide/nickel transport system permease protein n=1 Tax=Paenibacillus sediminis TaxID=664909 RepID=A0ABS4GY75_9BACL|nr:ABC transporter permease [Paenibacillus sediminis]MBP1935224.1 peptide/nickel transport system permease protein [Paenibacillus sediminis]
MWQYIIRRLLQAIPTLLGVSIIIFFVFALTPGDYVDTNIQLTPEKAHELKVLYGLDKPIIERYFIWLGNVMKGDFGFSLQFQKPVTSLLNDYIWNSFLIAIVSLILTWTIAILIGVYSALKKYSWFDVLVTLGVFAAMSFPSFFLGLLLIKFFAVDLKWLPVGGMTYGGSNSTGMAYVLEVLKHMILPVSVLTMLSVGSLTRYFRANMLDVIRQDFVRTARAKGLKERVVIFKHALRNASLPAITLLGFELPGLFAGAIITEKIFAWPGVGHIHMQALDNRDYTVLMGFTMFLAILTVLGNLLADIFYSVADPRIRLK